MLQRKREKRHARKNNWVIGLDILKIVSMAMIVVLHYLGHEEKQADGIRPMGLG